MRGHSWVATTLKNALPVVCGLLATAATPVLAQDAGQLTQRVELPIRFKIVSGATRMWVPVSIGGSRTIEAIIDTGSVGMSVMSSVLDDTSDLPDLSAYQVSFGSGDNLHGRNTHGTVTLGDTTADMPFAVITTAGCLPDKPECPSGKVPFEDFGLAGEGVPGEGFKAILGIGLGSSTSGHPLTSIGVTSWLIDIPIPGISEVGKLILNPDDADREGFKMIDAGVAFLDPDSVVGGSLPGCLTVRETSERVCGPIILDTGADALVMVTKNKPLFKRLEAGGQFDFEFGDSEDRLGFTIAIPPKGVQLQTPAPDLRAPRQILYAGVRPYGTFTVLYDAANNQVGLKHR